MTEDRGRLRISNADREQAIERLQQALDEGRIDLNEFDERTKGVYDAKTNAELDILFDDLPLDRAEDRSVNTIDLTPEEQSRREKAVQQRVRKRGAPPILKPLVVVACITTAIWLLSSVSSGELQNFWPVWPIGIMSAVALAQWITGETEDDEDEDDDKQQSC